MIDLGMIRVASVSPKLKIGNTFYNTGEILRCVDEALENNADLIVFPALCITGSSCGDLFRSEVLYEGQLKGLNEIALATKKVDSPIILGIFIKKDNILTECGALLHRGLIKGITPKYYPCSDFHRKDCFQPASEAGSYNFISLFGMEIPYGSIVFTDHVSGLTIGIEVDDDAFAPISPGKTLSVNGALIIANPAANQELIGSSVYRRSILTIKSRECLSSYVYSSAGALESSSAGIYSGHCLIAEGGHLLNEGSLPTFDSKVIFADIDYKYLMNERLNNTSFRRSIGISSAGIPVQKVELSALPVFSGDTRLERIYSKTPFVPDCAHEANSNCIEGFRIQSLSLARRLIHTGAKKVVLGISGGLDSTLALLVVAQAMKIVGKPPKDIITVTMPGFGTTSRTYQSAMAMMEALGTDIREIPIKDATLLHFKDIGHDPQVKNTVYENVQARERTQILMDIANMEGGIQIGTGDLSEAALGWSTYNGDHMSMYSVNAGVPKTFIRLMIRWFASEVINSKNREDYFDCDDKMLASALLDVLDTPVSPELLPPDENDNIAQKTEDQVGPYVLHDFFLYHTIRRGTPPSKLLFIASNAFADEYEPEFIKKWLIVFYKRFFTNQFKRSCVPDSPKVGSVNLSPKGDWNMPSDADVSLWLENLGVNE